jgi:2,3-diketo-5-methylthiopentyl-1-phosphate enolase
VSRDPDTDTEEAGDTAADADRIVATYLVRAEPGVDIRRAAQALADLQSTGSWVPPPTASSDIRARHGGRVTGLWQAPDHELADPPADDTSDWIVEVAFPAHNLGAQLPLLLATVYGECASLGTVKLVDLLLPESFTRAFAGPRLGIAGLRERLDAHDRPLVLVMMKPSIGLSPAESGEVFRELALGGADLVKDDELLVSHPWSELTDRVRAHAAAARQAFEETGHPTLFLANVTDRPDRMLDNARRAIDAGATGLMVDYLATGIASLSMLADDPTFDVPLLAHLAFSGAHYASPHSGVSAHLVLGLLPRLAGADMVVYPGPYGSLRFTRASHLRVADALRSPMQGIRPAVPAPGGGLHAGLVASLLDDLGNDQAIGVGSAVHSHPMGPAAGVRAVRQAIDAALRGEDLAEAAVNLPELAAAPGIMTRRG